jgi:Tfp pilus assembly protein FimT
MKFFRKKTKNQKGLALSSSKGFSVVETLVVIFIIVLLTTLFAVNYKSGQQRYALNSAVQRLSADLHRAQNFALSGSTQGASTPTGYGIHVIPGAPPTQYVLFYNTAGRVYGGTSVSLDTITLPGGVSIDTGFDIFFEPPDPTTYINGQPSNSRTFILTSPVGALTKNITVYASGRIEL